MILTSATAHLLDRVQSARFRIDVRNVAREQPGTHREAGYENWVIVPYSFDLHTNIGSEFGKSTQFLRDEQHSRAEYRHSAAKNRYEIAEKQTASSVGYRLLTA